jgi:integrase
MGFRTPAYRLHKGSGQALVEINGRRIYLGKYGSDGSRERYRRVVGEWLACSGRPAEPSQRDSVVSVNELLLAFLTYADQRYVKNGRPTSEPRSFRVALRPVKELYGLLPLTSFGPLALIACRQRLIEQGICRKRINQHVGRIRQVFKWGVARELVPETVWRALCAVTGLRRGEAPETQPVKSVLETAIAAVQPYLTPQIWAMIQLQLWTGCRPGEVCQLRRADIIMTGTIWEYRPSSHKTEHHGKERVVFLGHHAQHVLRPWLDADPNAFLFSPKESREWHLAKRRAARQTPLTPSQERRKRKSRPKRTPGDHFTTLAYGHAVSKACEKAFGMPPHLSRISKQLTAAQISVLKQQAAVNGVKHTAGARINYGIPQPAGFERRTGLKWRGLSWDTRPLSPARSMRKWTGKKHAV